jgi:hypothetical protein
MKINIMKKGLGFLLVVSASLFSHATEKACYAYLEADTLFIGNDQIERKYLWNGGNLITLTITDKINSQIWENQSKNADFYVPQQKQEATKGSWSAQTVETPISPSHMEVTVEYTLERLMIRRIFRVYPGCPAIAMDTYLKGKANGTWIVQKKDLGVWKYLDFRNELSQQNEMPLLDQISLPGRHWKLDVIYFHDNSDSYNTFVAPSSFLSYHENVYKGNILFFRNTENDKGLFYLKEAPLEKSQLAYPGADFIARFGHIKPVGLGLVVTDVQEDEWVKTYSLVIGVSAGDENNRLKALHCYLKGKKKIDSGRDEMVVMNTWGDRGDLSRLTEDFCIKQMEACAELGISHFQLDWGWQEGANNKGFENWSPKRSLYPNGLAPIVSKGKELGVELCLYLVPGLKYDNESWEDDADALIRLYKEYDIRVFKIDGQMMQTKIAEIRTRKMYEKVMKETDYNVTFNIDITAGQRGGFFYLNECGNLFIENRYTHWQSYYPYTTLRNLWMLSRYVPAEKIMIEFLNKWKNREVYKDDLFAPANYSFDYLFAIAMPGQPLAFLDAGDLPDNPFENPNLIKTYRQIQHDFHQGMILPVGEEPSGKSWTGFQSIQDKKGYLLVFRELTQDKQTKLNTRFEAGEIVEFAPVLGDGQKFRQKIGADQTVLINLPKPNSFALFSYRIIK